MKKRKGEYRRKLEGEGGDEWTKHEKEVNKTRISAEKLKRKLTTESAWLLSRFLREQSKDFLR